MRRRSAALRHSVLAAAVACAATMPLLGRSFRRGTSILEWVDSRGADGGLRYRRPRRAACSPDGRQRGADDHCFRGTEYGNPGSPSGANALVLRLDCGTRRRPRASDRRCVRLRWLESRSRRVVDRAMGPHSGGRRASAWVSSRSDPPRERAAGTARDMGSPASADHPARGRSNVDRRSDSCRPRARDRACSQARLVASDSGRSSSVRLLVQSDSVDCLCADAPGKRAGMRRHGSPSGDRRAHVRRTSAGNCTRVSTASRCVGTGGGDCLSIEPRKEGLCHVEQPRRSQAGDSAEPRWR